MPPVPSVAKISRRVLKIPEHTAAGIQRIISNNGNRMLMNSRKISGLTSRNRKEWFVSVFIDNCEMRVKVLFDVSFFYGRGWVGGKHSTTLVSPMPTTLTLR